MSSESEIQYVALRNIQLICQIRPTVLHGDVSSLSLHALLCVVVGSERGWCERLSAVLSSANV